MTDLRLTVSPYDLALVHPLRNARDTTFRREGTIVSVTDENGLSGWGEAAPLDADENERARTTLDALVAITLAGWRLEGSGIDAVEVAVNELLSPKAPAAVRCGLETALLDLEARRLGVSLSALLGGPASGSVEINALASEHGAVELGAHVAGLATRGFRTFKIKVGAASADADVVRVRAACEKAGRNAVVRLDANHAWTNDQAISVLGGLDGLPIDYVEDPLAADDGESLSSLCTWLRGNGTIAIAADESIALPADVEKSARDGCGVVVIKLQRVGGPLTALRLARAAQGLGLRVVLTDSLESRIGRAATLHCAAACTSEAVGLAGAFCLPDGAAHARPRIDLGAESLGHGAATA